MPMLILASCSPRRLDLLRQVNIIPELVIPADIDEAILKKELPSAYVKRVALLKAEKISKLYKNDYILSADTIVTMGRRILPKTEDDTGVKACLTQLSGRSHLVITSVCIATPTGKIAQKTVATRVIFKRLSSYEIDMYIKSQEGIGKAGGYAIQGLAECFVRRINGSFSSIVGLPLYQTVNMLNGAGYNDKNN